MATQFKDIAHKIFDYDGYDGHRNKTHKAWSNCTALTPNNQVAV